MSDLDILIQECQELNNILAAKCLFFSGCNASGCNIFSKANMLYSICVDFMELATLIELLIQTDPQSIDPCGIH